MEALIQIKTPALFLKEENKSQSQLVIDKFIEACVNLDASLFEPYMNEDDVFNSLGKYEFLAELKDLFEYSQFKTDYNFNVNMTNEQYDEFDIERSVLNFEVRFAGTILSVGDFSYCIEMENGNLKDIYRCHQKTRKESLLKPKRLQSLLCDECEKFGYCRKGLK